MLWPWAEGVSALPGLLGVKSLNLKDDQIPKLRKWAKTMSEVPLVKELLVPIPKIVQAIADRKNNTFDYDTFFDY